MNRVRALSMVVILSASFSASVTAEVRPVSGQESAALEISGIAATTGEDEPRILFILPWQPPSLPRRPRAELEARAPELEEPLDPLAVERHRKFRSTLDPMIMDSQGIQP